MKFELETYDLWSVPKETADGKISASIQIHSRPIGGYPGKHIQKDIVTLVIAKGTFDAMKAAFAQAATEWINTNYPEK